jgi:uncharacterized SAM-binding protein YcdF (DUF218 family)/glycosyltransferase involved in cell wall biosynthesis
MMPAIERTPRSERTSDPAHSADAAARVQHDVICISSIDWDFIWQGHQEIMSTLAAQGHRVLFVENTGVRAPKLRDMPRLRQRIRNWAKGTRGFRQERPNLFVLSPIVLPLPYSRVARWLNRTILAHLIRRWMRAVEWSRPIVWTFLPTPLAHDLIDRLNPALTIYYCIDDLASSSPEARRITGSEERMFRRADLVFVTSEKLRLRAAAISPRVHFFPFGVRYESFAAARASTELPPADISGLPRPVVGYVGGMHQWVDQDLIVDVARRLPHVTFAFIGPAQCDLSRLEGCSNVKLLGGKPHSELPAYIREFDIGIVPYKLSEYTTNVYPTKLNEYLAMGIPVVATDLLEIQRFNIDHGNIVSIAPDAAGFAEAIERTLRHPKAVGAERRLEVARSNSWQSRIAQMQGLINDALEEKRRTAGRWDLRLRRAYQLARRRFVAVAAVLALSYVALFETPLVWAVAAPLRVSESPRPADAIVVFAGGVGESGQAGGGYQERVKQAVDLFHAGYASELVFSSGFVFAFREAEVMRTLAISSGVPATAIHLESQARNTYENVRLSAEIVRQRDWDRVLLVSSPYHMRRALLTWQRVAPDIEVIATPVPLSQFYAHERGASLEQIRGIAQEYAAIALYWWRDWI